MPASGEMSKGSQLARASCPRAPGCLSLSEHSRFMRYLSLLHSLIEGYASWVYCHTLVPFAPLCVGFATADIPTDLRAEGSGEWRKPQQRNAV